MYSDENMQTSSSYHFDDTNLFVSAKTMNELESKAYSYLLNLDNWLKVNKLHLNIDKTCYSVFSPNKIPVPTVTIKINDTKIKRVKELSLIHISEPTRPY